MRTGEKLDEEVRVFNDAKRKPQLDMLEILIKKKGPYLCGDHFTIADIRLFFEITTEYFIGRKDWSDYPAIDEWQKRVSSVAEIQKIQELFLPVAASMAEKIKDF
mmetsp:Transcript_5685/g.5188  ORF Transcript_5685/g.5188 Transcript_5685/m.5188 type:complete len:105 (-) Transcript_5685:61-375(-)|eukprot:CAMPEP_0170555954 /NCGR_PEP_ID=MMETSP0211-20121228/14845_1 /TAXON_ID=311385 /ORGANISM="Pseudokeronopsis sp., Strain OXSARD2" /LENGTH=104 /DNA_ID=CAMNT_0010866001 /DNA_START=381 /DNA_END=695 /DNA_ORIENTATION=+